MRLMKLLEATRPYENKLIDPALMTFQEYRSMVDPTRKRHPSDSYDATVDTLNRYQKPADYPEVVNRFTRHQRQFEVRRNPNDRWTGQYVKSTPAGDIVRDEHGRAVMMTPEEVSARYPGDERYNSQFAIVDLAIGKIVAVTQDEWGTLLVMTAQEYRNFGFGTMLVKLKRTVNPDTPSGGFTGAGLNNFFRVYQSMVRDYLASGFYSHLVKSGQLTGGRAKEIIASANLTPQKKHKDRNFNIGGDPVNRLYLNHEDTAVLIYDRTFYEFSTDEIDGHDHWASQVVRGFASLHAFSDGGTTWLGDIYGATEKDAKIAVLLLMNIQDGWITVTDEDARLLKLDLYEVRPFAGRRDAKQYRTIHQVGDFDALFDIEKRIRSKRDPYGELFNRLLELGEGLAKDQ